MNEFIRDSDFLLSFLRGRGNRLVALDVGAHQGRFTRALLGSNRFEKVHAFEPNPLVRVEFLEELEDSRMMLHAEALSDQEGEVMLWCDADTATGSLLPYHPDYKCQGEVTGAEIRTTTLDAWSRTQDLERLDLLKIDTQGNDHRVLKGGGETVRRFRPVIMVELVFAPLYSNQGSLADILFYFDGCGYKLARIRNIHEDGHGLISFADAFFVPEELVVYEGNRFVQVDNMEPLHTELESLRHACQERLDCINVLDAELRRLRESGNGFAASGLKTLMSKIFRR